MVWTTTSGRRKNQKGNTEEGQTYYEDTTRRGTMPDKGVAPLPHGEGVPEARFWRAVADKRTLTERSFQRDRGKPISRPVSDYSRPNSA